MIDWLTGPPAGSGPPPSLERWLSPAELDRLSRFHVLKRRREWLLGRFTAKSLVASAMARRGSGELPLLSIEIVPEPSGAPVARLASSGERLPVSVSISHSGARALAALLFTDAPDGRELSAGADLEKVDVTTERFIGDFLTGRERDEIASLPTDRRAARASGIWSAKEAVLKALRLGLTVDTWKVECLLDPGPVPEAPGALVPEGPPWRRFSVRCAPEILPGRAAGTELFGFWREADGFVMTLAAARTGAPVSQGR